MASNTKGQLESRRMRATHERRFGGGDGDGTQNCTNSSNSESFITLSFSLSLSLSFSLSLSLANSLEVVKSVWSVSQVRAEQYRSAAAVKDARERRKGQKRRGGDCVMSRMEVGHACAPYNTSGVTYRHAGKGED